MFGHGRYGKNGWKIKFMNAVVILIFLVVLAGIGGAGYFIVWPKVQVVLKERKEAENKRRESESKRLQKESELEIKRLQEESERLRLEESKKDTQYRSTYEVFISDKTWIQAYDDAISRGGYLVVINSAEEQKKVESLLEQYGHLHTVWLGGMMKNEIINWVNGQDVTYTKWGNGEPNNDTGDEEYLDMYEIDDVWYWNDVPNDIKQYYSGKMGYVVEYEREIE